MDTTLGDIISTIYAKMDSGYTVLFGLLLLNIVQTVAIVLIAIDIHFGAPNANSDLDK